MVVMVKCSILSWLSASACICECHMLTWCLWCRESLEVPRLDYEEPEDLPLIGSDAAVIGDPAYAECAHAAGRRASWCRSATVAVHNWVPRLKPHCQIQISVMQLSVSQTLNFLPVHMQFTVVLLLRHLIAMVTVGAANQYAFSLLTVSLFPWFCMLAWHCSIFWQVFLWRYTCSGLVGSCCRSTSSWGSSPLCSTGRCSTGCSCSRWVCGTWTLVSRCRGGLSEQVLTISLLLQEQRRNASRIQRVSGQVLQAQQHMILVGWRIEWSGSPVKCSTPQSLNMGRMEYYLSGAKREKRRRKHRS